MQHSANRKEAFEFIRSRNSGLVSSEGLYKFDGNRPPNQSCNRLVRMVEEAVVPRLVKAHSGDSAEKSLIFTPPPIGQDDVIELVRLMAHHDPAVVSAHLQAMMEKGVPVESLLLDLMAPAARLLGVYWEEDELDFMEVTLGVSELQNALRDLDPAFVDGPRPLGSGPKILLAIAPGDQHTFGLFVVEEFFRRAGWNVTLCATESRSQLVDTALADTFAVVGFSMSRDILLDELTETIAAIHKVPKTDRPAIMVGGRAFAENPEFLSLSGADALAADGLNSVEVAERLASDAQKIIPELQLAGR